MTTAVSNTAASTAATAAAAKKTSMSQLGAQDFLKLLTTQLNNQDPTAPVDNAQMVAQLAQFSSLSAATDTRDTLKTISTQLDTLIHKTA